MLIASEVGLTTFGGIEMCISSSSSEIEWIEHCIIKDRGIEWCMFRYRCESGNTSLPE